MNIRTIATGIFAVLLFMGFNISQKATENGMITDIGFVPAVIADDTKSKDKSASTPAPLICQCKAASNANDQAAKADKASKEAKDSKDRADKNKADIDKDKNASDKDKKSAKDKADKADKDYKAAKESKDKADKDKKDVDDLIKSGAPCTCPDGSSGFWGTDTTGGGAGGSSSGNPAPEAFRELHGN